MSVAVRTVWQTTRALIATNALGTEAFPIMPTDTEITSLRRWTEPWTERFIANAPGRLAARAGPAASCVICLAVEQEAGVMACKLYLRRRKLHWVYLRGH